MTRDYVDSVLPLFYIGKTRSYDAMAIDLLLNQLFKQLESIEDYLESMSSDQRRMFIDRCVFKEALDHVRKLKDTNDPITATKPMA